MDKFYALLFKQLDSLFFFTVEERALIETLADKINQRFLYNCSNLKTKYYLDLSLISPYHSGQYTMFLYFAANTIFKENGRAEICDKIYNLLKIISGADIYYEVNLPDIFMFDHPTGTVLGRAAYGNGFVFSQGCTVGNNKGIYPVIGEFVIMNSNSKIIGNCKIGNNVILSANTFVKDTDIPPYSLVFGGDKNLIIKPLTVEKAKTYFDSIFKNQG